MNHQLCEENKRSPFFEGEHITVLREQTVDALQIKPGGIYVDCTLGGGGHAALICERMAGQGLLIGIDQDTYALKRAGIRLADFNCEKNLVHDSFFNLEMILNQSAPMGVDGICFDLGVSSFQFDDAARGFSYHHEGPLDMRMDQSQSFNAAEVVNTYSKEKLVRILKDYGEERFATQIANRIIRERQEKPIATTSELAEIVRLAYPPKARFQEKHPARKTFQAIRIEVNHELDDLETALLAAIDALRPGGRLAVITFHSLEDRIVKQCFKNQVAPCVCPPAFPVCVCGKKPSVRMVTGKPIEACEKELSQNRRSRSAKLRVVEKIING